MDKGNRNLLITGMASAVVGIIMGIGLVAPSIERPADLFSEVLIDTNVDLTVEAMDCKYNLGVIQDEFDRCVAITEVAQRIAKDTIDRYEELDDITSRCIDALDGKVNGRTSL